MPGMRRIKGTAVITLALAATAVPAARAAEQTAPRATDSMLHAAAVGQCTDSSSQSARSVTFDAEARALRGASRIWIRIDLQERLPGGYFKTVKGPGKGVWRGSAPGVSIFQAQRTLTNLAAPAAYRAAVHYRWTAAGRTVHREMSYTSICRQVAHPRHG